MPRRYSHRPRLRVGFRRAFAARSVIDDRSRIGRAKFHARAFEFQRRCAPWLVDQARRQWRELRHPAPDIPTIGIELQDRIEHAEIGCGIGAGAGGRGISSTRGQDIATFADPDAYFRWRCAEAPEALVNRYVVLYLATLIVIVPIDLVFLGLVAR